jgi:BMFP domain-containing protein YqiC
MPFNDRNVSMQSSNRLLDDLAKVASGAASAVAGVREEVEGLVRQRVERLIADLDLVSRDEFDVAKAMAAKARAEQEKLEQRLQALEAALARMEAGGAQAQSRADGEAPAKPPAEGALP